MAYPKTHNPFDDDEEDDFRPKRREFGDGEDDDDGDSGLSEPERRQRHLQQQVMRTAQSAVDSSHRSLGLIYESEKIGVETAEELVRQGEVLKRADKMMDNMDQDLNTSQKHINGIKSMWGGLVNYFRAKPETKPPPEEPKAYQANDRLQTAMSSSRGHEDKYQASHPNLRKLNTGDFGGSGSSMDDKNGYPQNRHLREAHQTLDNNLDEMCGGLSRLKSLGLGLQSEIDDQDDSLDSLMNKVDKMDLKINKTNQQITNLK
ncbi:synaptosomal-associated protein 29 [Pseudoliparis swirei]|uniref:synaptosomal-associated protein 29 n=1 Tax=Pseudoliparis swirei TaxID=2059687 RepID=UPI0024BD88B5|nr:synaptosomal-associated protein 29 [Pseudoliparis swirei]XP_056275583.1 synaptosomal-associated protein 29 [Pseudoliparis swirei]XP_056275584.1 synaptosomal-associated protein 29 [Pseudoliparis swirei]